MQIMMVMNVIYTSPQTEEARAEVSRILLDVKKNLVSPTTIQILLEYTQDSVTGNYLLGLGEFSKEFADDLLYKCGIMNDSSVKIISGNEIISQILPKINFENNSLKVKDGKIVKGVVDKTIFSDEDGEMIMALDRDFGRDITFDTIRKAYMLRR